MLRLARGADKTNGVCSLTGGWMLPAVSRTGRSLAAGGARAGINGGVVAAVQGRLHVVHVHRLEDGLALLDGLPVEEQPGGRGSEASPSQHRKARGVCMWTRRHRG